MKEATLSSVIAGLETSMIALDPCTAISLVGAITRTYSISNLTNIHYIVKFSVFR